MAEFDRRWVVNTLEVIVEHYRDLEQEIREVRQEHEQTLSRLKIEDYTREHKEAV